MTLDECIDCYEDMGGWLFCTETSAGDRLMADIQWVLSGPEVTVYTDYFGQRTAIPDPDLDTWRSF